MLGHVPEIGQCALVEVFCVRPFFILNQLFAHGRNFVEELDTTGECLLILAERISLDVLDSEFDVDLISNLSLLLFGDFRELVRVIHPAMVLWRENTPCDLAFLHGAEDLPVKLMIQLVVHEKLDRSLPLLCDINELPVVESAFVEIVYLIMRSDDVPHTLRHDELGQARRNLFLAYKFNLGQVYELIFWSPTLVIVSLPFLSLLFLFALGEVLPYNPCLDFLSYNPSRSIFLALWRCFLHLWLIFECLFSHFSHLGGNCT